jgi:hypothetical protein
MLLVGVECAFGEASLNALKASHLKVVKCRRIRPWTVT